MRHLLLRTFSIRLRPSAESIHVSRCGASREAFGGASGRMKLGIAGLHRITNPQDSDPTFWEFFKIPLIVDLAADVLGPDVKFHHCKLSIKSEKNSKGFGRHQDILGWPHTDFSPVTLGILWNGAKTPAKAPSRSHSSSVDDWNDHAQTVNSHAAIVDPIETRDEQAAASAMLEAINIGCRRINNSARERVRNG
jgi:hypothetical protein